MEMVASSKMRKTQDRMEMGRPYADRMLSVIGHLANSNPEYKPLYMTERETKNIGIIVVSSDKGLCGGLNINLFRNLVGFLKEQADQGIGQQFCSVGTKAKVFFNSYGGNVVAAAEKLGDVYKRQPWKWSPLARCAKPKTEWKWADPMQIACSPL